MSTPKPISTVHPAFLIVLAAFAVGAGGTFSVLVTRGQEMGVPSSAEGEIPQHCLLSNQDNQRQLKDQASSLKDNLREIKNAKRDVTKAGRQADVAKLDALAQEIASKQTILKNLQAGRFPPGEDCFNDVMQEHFYNNNFWDTLNEVRACSQVTNQLKDRHSGLTQLERNSKSITRRLTKAGLDAAPLASAIEQSKVFLTEIEQKNNAGQCVEAQEKMNELNQTVDPYALQGAFDQTANALDQLRRVRNPEAKAAFEDLLAPIRESLQKGEYQEVNELWGELNRDGMFWDMLNRAGDSRTFRGSNATQFDEKFGKLSQLFEKFGQKIERPPAYSPEPALPPSATACITQQDLPTACAAAGFVLPAPTAIPAPPPPTLSAPAF